MIQKFLFRFPDAKTISLVGDFNNWDANQNIMKKNDDGIWSVDVEINYGYYRYKYLIDSLFLLNDPFANMYIPGDNGELYSLLIINENGERIINTEEYNVHIKQYNICDRITEGVCESNKKSFNQTDEKIVCRLEFTNVTGIHSTSMLWYKPNNEFYYIIENVLYASDDENNKPIIQWFWIDIKDGMPPGKWKVKFYIDGAFIFEDYFIIKPRGYVFNNGRVSFK